MKARLLFDKKKCLFYVVRVVDSTKRDRSHSDNAEEYLNKLLQTKSPEQLIDAIDDMPSLYPETASGIEKFEFSFAEANAEFEKRFTDPDNVRLEAELFLTAPKPLRGNRLNTKTFSDAKCCSGSAYLEFLEQYDKSNCCVLVEHLQDWMTLRNSLNLCARLLGQIEEVNTKTRTDVSLEKTGFRYKENMRLNGKRMYITPFKYNPFFAKKFEHSELQDPLFESMVVSKIEETSIPLVGNIAVRHFQNKGNGVSFITKPVATEESRSLVKDLFRMERGESSEDKTLYLCVEDSGSEIELAKQVVSSFSYGFRTLNEKKDQSGQRLGWEYDDEGEFEKLNGPRLVPHSFISALFYALVYHPGKRITVCKNCGNAVLSREQGTRKEYCSNSCRVQASRSNGNSGTQND